MYVCACACTVSSCGWLFDWEWDTNERTEDQTPDQANSRAERCRTTLRHLFFHRRSRKSVHAFKEEKLFSAAELDGDRKKRLRDSQHASRVMQEHKHMTRVYAFAHKSISEPHQ